MITCKYFLDLASSLDLKAFEGSLAWEGWQYASEQFRFCITHKAQANARNPNRAKSKQTTRL